MRGRVLGRLFFPFPKNICGTLLKYHLHINTGLLVGMFVNLRNDRYLTKIGEKRGFLIGEVIFDGDELKARGFLKTAGDEYTYQN